MHRQLWRIAAAALAVIALGSPAIGGAAAAQSDLQALRAATARFHDVSAAGRAGYAQPPAPAPLHECISSFDDTGAMGFHFINGGLLDSEINPTQPEVLVYAPDKRGRLRLVALEFVVFQADWIAAHGNTMPELFGQMFMATGFPNRFDIPAFFSLHVWLYQDNPAGLFAPFNPDVSCGSQTALAPSKAALAAAVDRAPRWLCPTALRTA
jgi:hypothetical protein